MSNKPTITYQGLTLVYDQDVPADRFYTISPGHTKVLEEATALAGRTLTTEEAIAVLLHARYLRAGSVGPRPVEMG